MTLPGRLCLTIGATRGCSSNIPDRAVHVLHDWIARRALDDILVDVADYRHVTDGPGIVLVGAHANYSLTDQGGQVYFSCFGARLLEDLTLVYGSAPLVSELGNDARPGVNARWSMVPALSTLRQRTDALVAQSAQPTGADA